MLYSGPSTNSGGSVRLLPETVEDVETIQIEPSIGHQAQVTSRIVEQFLWLHFREPG